MRMRVVGLSSALLLAGCGQAWSSDPNNQAVIRDIGNLQNKVNALRSELESQKQEAEETKRVAVDTHNGLVSLRKTVNANAHSANRNAVRGMSRNGACGTEVYYDWNYVRRERYRDCTTKDRETEM